MTIITDSTSHSAGGGNMNTGLLFASLESASSWYNVASVFFLISLAVGAVTALIIFLAGNDKEIYLKNALAATSERTAKAEQKAAEADLARLKLEEKLAPRSLSQSQIDVLRDKLKQFTGISVLMHVYGDVSPDIIPLSAQIRSALNSAGWQTSWGSVLGGTRQVVGLVVMPRVADDKTKSAIDCHSWYT